MAKAKASKRSRERAGWQSPTTGDPLQVELWPIDRLLPFAANARTHPDEQIAQIAGSIAEFGFNVPCLVDDRGVLIAGHGRVLSARRLGLQQVPVIRLGHLSDAQVRAFRLADNRIALNAGWDDELLSAELERLKEDGVALELLGFAEDELDRLLHEFDAGETAEGEDDVPKPPAEAITRPGDLWRLGPHRLLCGDATSAADLECLMADARAHMCFTDSPYNVDYIGGPLAGGRRAERRIMNDALGKGFGRFLFDACSNIIAHTDKQWRAVADQLRPKVPKLAALMDEAETDVLAFMTFPKDHRTKIHSINPLERLNGEIKRRTDVVGIFPTRMPSRGSSARFCSNKMMNGRCNAVAT